MIPSSCISRNRSAGVLMTLSLKVNDIDEGGLVKCEYHDSINWSTVAHGETCIGVIQFSKTMYTVISVDDKHSCAPGIVAFSSLFFSASDRHLYIFIVCISFSYFI